MYLLYSDIFRNEGVPALFKGLGPTLVGVIPARSINFYTYGNGKQIIASKFNDGKESASVHLSAAAFAGEEILSRVSTSFPDNKSRYHNRYMYKSNMGS
jgi:hypothetical protein